MSGLTIKGIDTRGVELHVHIGGDGRITANTPLSDYPPNDLFIGALPDGLVPDTGGERVIELRGKHLKPGQLLDSTALAIHGWLVLEWSSFGIEAFEGCLARQVRAASEGAAMPPLTPAQAGALDPQFGNKLVSRVMRYCEQWQTANR